MEHLRTELEGVAGDVQFSNLGCERRREQGGKEHRGQNTGNKERWRGREATEHSCFYLEFSLIVWEMAC